MNHSYSNPNWTIKLLLTVSVFIFLSASVLHGQVKPNLILNDPDYDFEKRLRFGFSVGINTMNFSIINTIQQEDELLYANVSTLHPGFNVNALSFFTLYPGLQARCSPGLAFGQRDIDFFYDNGNLHGTVKNESSFIEIPLYLKYNAERKTNARPYLLGGANYRIDLARKSTMVGEGQLDENETFFTLTRNDIYYEIGAGYEFYLEYFKFSVELKYSVGLMNVLESHDESRVSERYFAAIDRLRSQIFTISFNFE